MLFFCMPLYQEDCVTCFTRGDMLLLNFVGSFLFTPNTSQEKFAVCVYPNITRSVSECWTVTWLQSLLVDRAVYCCKLKPVHFAGCQESYHAWMVADPAPKQLNVAKNIGSQYRKAWRYHCCWEDCSCRNTVAIFCVSLKSSNGCFCLYPSHFVLELRSKSQFFLFFFCLCWQRHWDICKNARNFRCHVLWPLELWVH